MWEAHRSRPGADYFAAAADKLRRAARLVLKTTRTPPFAAEVLKGRTASFDRSERSSKAPIYALQGAEVAARGSRPTGPDVSEFCRMLVGGGKKRFDFALLAAG